MTVIRECNFDYEPWAKKQIKDKKRMSILLQKAEYLASLVPKNMYFERALEIGCAEGIVINKLKKLLKINKCYGIDISKIFLSLGRDLYPEIEFIESSGSQLPFPEKYFDLVILSDIIEHIKDIEDFMGEVWRIGKRMLLKVPLENYFWRKVISEPLKRSPKVGVDHPDGHVHEFTKRSCERLINEMGFNILSSKVYYDSLSIETYKGNNLFLKSRWLIDFTLKRYFPSIAHKIFGGNLLIFAENCSKS